MLIKVRVVYFHAHQSLSSIFSINSLHAGYFFMLLLFFQKKPIRNNFRVSNSLDPDHNRHFVGSDLGPNWLQVISR